jgi:hypothetical protein
MDALFHGIAIIALLFSNILLIAVGFMAARQRGGASAEPGAARETPVSQELKGVSLSLAALSERLVKLEIQIAQLRDQAGQQPLPLNREAEQKSFKVATKLALQGASVEEIVDLCGLARGEAELICMLHSSNQVSPSGVAGELNIPPKKPARAIESYDSIENADGDLS